MIHRDFTYASPTTFEEAVSGLKGSQTEVMLGDQALTSMLKNGEIETSGLISVLQIPGVNELSFDEEYITIGPAVTYSRLLEYAALSSFNALTEVLASVTDPHLLNHSTIGGALYYRGSNSGSIAAALAVLDAKVELISSLGINIVPIYRWLAHGGISGSAAGTIVKSIKVPLYARLRSTYKYSNYLKSGLWSFGVAASAPSTELNADVKVVLSGYRQQPLILNNTINWLSDGQIDYAFLTKQLEMLIAHQPAISQQILSVDYLTHLYKVLVRRALNDITLT